MPNTQSPYDFIKNKIHAIQDIYPSLRGKSDDYIFSALAVKSHFYKNPSYILENSAFDQMIVDGQYDGGVDFLLTDPNSEASNLVIGQSKFYSIINTDDVQNAFAKMAIFFKEMTAGHYEQVNEKVQRRFLSLYSEIGEESKIHFVFFTSAPQNSIRKERIERSFRSQFTDSSNFEVSIFFGSDIVDDIKESESRRPTVESGKIKIDERDNVLYYGENAAIVNISAFSLKTLYAQYNTNLLARNLRYHVSGREIDKGIAETIQRSPEMFWLRNNGITIICDEFKIDGVELKLKNFSIVNGGQTTYQIYKSRDINETHDLYLPCKVIVTEGNTEDEKTAFSLEIAKSTNSQKAIKAIDLKANSPEQVRFSQTMREVDIFYQTKRGEVVPSRYREPYKNSDLAEIGKLCLSAIFQMPGTSRNKPSSLYLPKFYDITFDSDQTLVANISKELLYIDHYYRGDFQNKFDANYRSMPNEANIVAFAHNARTICTAFVYLATRYYNNNIDNDSIQVILNAANTETQSNDFYEVVRNFRDVNYLFKPELFRNKTHYEAVLYKLFELIIKFGVGCYTVAARYEEGLVVSNYLKKDRNYYAILQSSWMSFAPEIKRIIDEAYNA